MDFGANSLTRKPTERTSTSPNQPQLSSRKRSSPHTKSKRLRQPSSISSRKMREAKAASPSLRSDSRKERALRHAFPRGKEWDVADLCISMEEDGSLCCQLLWAPTAVKISSLRGALLERAEELAKRDFGTDIWDKCFETQGKDGRRWGAFQIPTTF
jgi:hypothetical protein